MLLILQVILLVLWYTVIPTLPWFVVFAPTMFLLLWLIVVGVVAVVALILE